MQVSIRSYVLTLAVASAALTAAVYWTDPTFQSQYVSVVGCFSLLGLIASFLAYAPTRNTAGSIAFLPMLTCSLLAPHWMGVAGIGAALLLFEVICRRAPIKVVFNTAQALFAAAVTTLVYRALGGVSLLQLQDFAYVPYIGASLFFFAANSLTISGVVGIQEGKSVWTLWLKRIRFTFAYDLLSIPFVFVFAYIYVHFGVLGASLFMIPLMGARQLYKTNWQLEKTNQELLELMVAAIEARDPYTSGHSRRVAENARVISRALGLRQREIDRIVVAALLHDVGKIHDVFGTLLSKPGKLSPEEHAIMRTHPIKSEELARNVSSLKDILPAIRHHHENWDGSGYPDGLFGAAIPIASRIIMFADTVDAMTTDRPYRAALDERAVRAELERHRGKQFDPKMYDTLVASPLFSLLFRKVGDKSLSDRTPAKPVLKLTKGESRAAS